MIRGRTGGIHNETRGYIQFRYRGKTKIAAVIEVEGINYALVNRPPQVYEIKTIRCEDVTLRLVKNRKTINKIVEEEEKQLQRKFTPGMLVFYMSR